jgi:hypothetical protein
MKSSLAFPAVVALALATALLIAACERKPANDGVPILADPRKPVDADGKPMTSIEFLKKYCIGKITNETCAKVIQAERMDSTRGPLPKGW